MSEVLQRSLETLFRELIEGPGGGAAWMLNRTDAGLLQSLDKLTASAASVAPAAGGASIASHVDHVRYGLSLLNRWSSGERDPWSTADWTASWNRSIVTDQEWGALRRPSRRKRVPGSAPSVPCAITPSRNSTTSSAASLTSRITSAPSGRSIARLSDPRRGGGETAHLPLVEDGCDP